MSLEPGSFKRADWQRSAGRLHTPESFGRALLSSVRVAAGDHPELADASGSITLEGRVTIETVMQEAPNPGPNGEKAWVCEKVCFYTADQCVCQEHCYWK
jgi:hypothetical protein